MNCDFTDGFHNFDNIFRKIFADKNPPHDDVELSEIVNHFSRPLFSIRFSLRN